MTVISQQTGHAQDSKLTMSVIFKQLTDHGCHSKQQIDHGCHFQTINSPWPSFPNSRLTMAVISEQQLDNGCHLQTTT